MRGLRTLWLVVALVSGGLIAAAGCAEQVQKGGSSSDDDDDGPGGAGGEGGSGCIASGQEACNGVDDDCDGVIDDDTTCPVPGDVCVAGVCGCPDSNKCGGATCVDLTTSQQHCGACNSPCAANETCSQSVCTCAAGLLDCNGTCADSSTSSAHCGGCNQPCGAGMMCQGGVCSCQPGLVQCGGGCINVSFDSSNCGFCGNVCDPGTTCQNGFCSCPGGQQLCNGQCIEVDFDPNNCGFCDNVCAAGPNQQSFCDFGFCSESCNPGFYDCDGGLNGCESMSPCPCDGQNDCSLCTECAINGACMQLFNACLNDPTCLDLDMCVGTCPDTVCVDACLAQYPNIAQEYQAIVECAICQTCPVDCNGMDPYWAAFCVP